MNGRSVSLGPDPQEHRQECAVTITLARPARSAQDDGRHRLGRSGLVPVTSLVVVVYRGWLSHLLRPGRHLLRVPRTRRSTAAPVPVAG